MTHSASAVAVGRNSQIVDVIHKRTVFCLTREASEVRGDNDTGAIGRDSDDNVPGNGAPSQRVEVGAREGGLVRNTRGVLLDGGIAKEALSRSVRHCFMHIELISAYSEAWVCRAVVFDGSLNGLDTGECGTRSGGWDDRKNT